jgi:hypothetical protein
MMCLLLLCEKVDNRADAHRGLNRASADQTDSQWPNAAMYIKEITLFAKGF